MTNNQEPILKTGTVLDGKYVILAQVGRGGMGEVYRAHQVNLNRDVAIKVLSREWLESCADNELEKESGLQRFRREVQAMARVRHPYVLQIHDFVSTGAEPHRTRRPLDYISMEFVPGNTLRATMSEQGFYPEEDLARQWIRRYFIPVLEGVEALHQAEIVHRDLKPENVLMDGERPKIADFGLVRSCRLPAVTKSYDVKGTLPYMSPEHYYDFGRADQRSDIYSLGKILYEAMDGKIGAQHLPFKQAALAKAETRFFTEIDRLIRQATEEDPEKRLQSADELSKLLSAALAVGETQPPADATAPSQRYRTLKQAAAGRRPLKTGLIAAAVLLLLVGGYGLLVVLSPSQGPQLGMQPSESTPTAETPAQLPAIGDEVTMPMIPGGSVTLPAGIWGDTAQRIKVETFFLDETQVTNHQFVQFLNRSLASIQVETEVVKNGQQVWLYLGEVSADYEPIVFRNGRFALTHSGHAACPVLRVTALGAEAYAESVGKRLPSVAEWYYAFFKGKKVSSSQNTAGVAWADDSMGGMHEQMHGDREPSESPQIEKVVPSLREKAISVPEPVITFEPNALGIRGLNEEIGEWAKYADPPLSEPSNEVRYAMLEATGEKPDGSGRLPRPIGRQPWEAGSTVGFRCARNASP